MVDVLIWWWEKERLAPPQLLARPTTLIVKKTAKLFVCKARQLLPTSDTGKSIQGPTNLVDQVTAILQAGLDWQNTHYTKCTWLVEVRRMLWSGRQGRETIFNSAAWVRGCLPKRAASGSDAWSGSVNTHPSKYYGSPDWKLEHRTIIVTGNG